MEDIRTEDYFHNERPLGIYIHIPFCVSKCIYCDFVSFPAEEGLKEAYVDAVCREIREFSREQKEKRNSYKVNTIFFGGGTPSLLKSSLIVEVMNAIRREWKISEEAEITVECNPGTLSREKLETYKWAGINRLSLGLQSADNRELKNLGRIHTYEEFLESYNLARAAGFDNINIDMMSAIPYQTTEGYKNNLEKIIKLEPEHISAYSLIVEEGTKLFDLVERCKNKILPTEEEDREMYALTKEILGKAGYERYEISNYAKAGYACRHNISYWKRTEYAGFGIAAASLIDGERYTNTSDIASYIQQPVKNRIEESRLTPEDQMEEFMFLGLRMMEGIDTERFEKEFGRSFWEIYGKTASRQIEQKLMKREGNRLFLTDFGIDISNSVMAEYML